MDGYLYFGDKPISRFEEMNITLEDESVENLPEHISTSMNVELDQLTVLSLLYGRQVMNNWLKMHGGVLIRKGLNRCKRVRR